jgi:hypothetical protein
VEFPPLIVEDVIGGRPSRKAEATSVSTLLPWKETPANEVAESVSWIRAVDPTAAEKVVEETNVSKLAYSPAEVDEDASID